ncbi:MAG: hypothetical protein ACP5TE_11450 [Verrucomicrobiia bacterium]|jgi:hypothetical protein
MKIINTIILALVIAIAPIGVYAGGSCCPAKDAAGCPAKSGDSKQNKECPKSGSGNEQTCPAGKDSKKDGKEKA